MAGQSTITRNLTAKEKRKMRLKHFVLIPVVVLSILFLWIVVKMDTLPVPARWAGGGIAVLASVIFFWKHIKMELDLRNGSVEVISGIITQKKKFGGNRKGVSTGVSHKRSSRGSGATYFIFINDRKFNVPPSIYTQVKESDKVEMSYFPKSQFYLEIKVID